MEPVHVAMISIGATLAVTGGGAVFGYGKIAARVDAADRRLETTEKTIKEKADMAAVVELHKDVREIRDLVLGLYQRDGRAT